MKKAKRKISELGVDVIDVSGEVDRMDVDSEKIEELAASIEEVGLLQPIIVRPVGERYEIVAGRRRYLAVSGLDAKTIEVIVREMSDQEAAIIRATENLSRENLTPLEEAAIFSNLLNKYNMEYEEIGEKFGYKAGTVRRRMDLLKMPEVLRAAVHKNKISVSVAEELWPISDEGDLHYYLTFAIESGCTKGTARGWCKDWKDQKRREKTPGEPGGTALAPMEPRPVYISCDLCVGPMVIGDETVMRVCKECFATIKANM